MIVDFMEGHLCELIVIGSVKEAMDLVEGTELDETETKEILDKHIRQSSDIWACVVDKGLVCFWGVTPKYMLSDEAYLWVLTTERVRKWPYHFLRAAEIGLDAIFIRYSRLVGVCQDEKAKKWLKRLGAVFGEAMPQTAGLVPFEIRRK